MKLIYDKKISLGISRITKGYLAAKSFEFDKKFFSQKSDIMVWFDKMPFLDKIVEKGFFNEDESDDSKFVFTVRSEDHFIEGTFKKMNWDIGVIENYGNLTSVFTNKSGGIDRQNNSTFGLHTYTLDDDFYFNEETTIKKGEELRIVTGEVLVPEETDGQGDIYSEEEVRKAAHGFGADYKGQGNGLMHLQTSNKNLKVIENYVTLANMTVNKRFIKKGTWMQSTLVLDQEIWKKIKKGEITGYSIGGVSNAKPA